MVAALTAASAETRVNRTREFPMNGFFKPLRRKIGVVTLGLACVFAVGWIRSSHYVDTLTFAKNESSTTQFGSSYSGIRWSTVERPYPFKGRLFVIQSVEAKPNDPIGTAKNPNFTTSSYGMFYFLSCRTLPLMFSTLVVYYWSIVIPLTLLSAWLLLSRPRASKPISPTSETTE